MPPALALVGAAASVAGGMAAVGGTMAGFLGAGLGTQLIAGAMIAGGVMTGIGAITGSQKLQKWGGLLSLAGGIGGMATGAWGQVANDAASAGFGGAEYGMADKLAGGMGGASGMGGAAGGMLQANLGVTDLGIGGASAGGMPATPNIAAPTIAGPSGVVPGQAAAGAQGAVQTVAKGVADAGGGILDTMKSGIKWMGASPENARITQAGAGLVQAGLGAYGQQEAVKTELRMREEAQARARQRLSDSVQGVTVPVYQRKGG